MATYGFGAAYAGTDDKVAEFVSLGVAFVGYDIDNRNGNPAPALHAILRQIEVGDIIFLKSFPPSQGLIVKAVGIATDVSRISEHRHGLGYGPDVHWTSVEQYTLGRLNDRYDNMRGGTLFREYNPDVIRRLLTDLIEA